ncbi:signal peptidase I [Candidatus Enterococcus clewellii]|uniref:Signal peptidase I n=1 Tax=Candidatus Enterococcus clewellii TaxID=1834193 RepID=A0A242K609_9ENTE|nr:signal peptidase I [Enterococcus sp. 9E7_DIV0242]OTP14584.1 signal peptidase I [Enterococcus sp. 9E7_DIV0242]
MNTTKFKFKRPGNLRREKQKRVILSAFFFLFLGGLLAVFLITIRPHQIDGVSMEPTLQNGDRLFIKKTQQPKRYELITFYPKENPSDSYVKRVVGLPGDKIYTEGNALYINHQMREDQALRSDTKAKDLPDGTLKVTITKNVWDILVDIEEIPEDVYFVLGDNRNNSTDSRHFGFVEKKQIEGVVMFRYYPFDSIGFIN